MIYYFDSCELFEFGVALANAPPNSLRKSEVGGGGGWGGYDYFVLLQVL